MNKLMLRDCSGDGSIILSVGRCDTGETVLKMSGEFDVESGDIWVDKKQTKKLLAWLKEAARKVSQQDSEPK